jgi:PadR family transcriptional regulator PadR
MPPGRDNLIPGTLNVLILKALSLGPAHGYALSRWIHESSREVLRVEEGVLYPALHRLERDGMIESRWGRNDTGRRAKFYSLTRKGRSMLKAEIERWSRSSDAVWSVLDAAG